MVSDSVANPYDEPRNNLSDQKQLFVDASPTKEKRRKKWLWVAVAPLFTVFGTFPNRKRESLMALIRDYKGVILNCDRAKVSLDRKRLLSCWAHLKRDIQEQIDSSDHTVKRFARPFRNELNSLLLRGRFSGSPRLIGFCNDLWSLREHLWTFIEVKGIEPTNIPAKRALRPAVICRKLSFATQCDSGSRYLVRILTVSETCRQQNRNVFAYLVGTVETKFAEALPPSLLPSDQAAAQAA